MEDLCVDADAGRLLTAALASGRPLAIVCHAPAAMLATRIHGVHPASAAVLAERLLKVLH
jgi:putative intracellular protease/amidase